MSAYYLGKRQRYLWSIMIGNKKKLESGLEEKLIWKRMTGGI